MNQRVEPVVVALSLLLSAPAVTAAPGQEPRERLLAQGWTELAAGRARSAAETASRILKDSPRDHDAVSLSVAAALAGPGPFAALDTYEQWLASSRREDVFLLEEIAVGELRALSKANEPRTSFAALALLAGIGNEAARAQLAALASETTLPLEAEAALARAGNPVGVRRLTARIAAGGPQDKSHAIRALQESGQPGIAAAIAEGLKDAAPPSRIAAASALAELRATETMPQLRAAVADPEPAVKTMVEVALAILGDPERRQVLAGLANSPLPDFRLIAARLASQQDPQGAWAPTAAALLEDPDPVIRLKAAELLLAHGRFDSVEAMLSVALNEPSAPVRTAAARLLTSVPHDQRGLALIRRLLRDGLAEVRLEAARALVRRR